MKKMENKLFQNTGFHHVAIKVKDFEKSVHLYSEILGLSEALSWNEKPTRVTMLDIGDGTYIELFEGGLSDGSKQNEPMVHFALLTDECDAMYHAALNAGCKSQLAPLDFTIRGYKGDVPVRISYVVGYDGEVIEFFQYI